MKVEGMTLLHHAAFDGNIEAASMMTSLPYFKELINDSNNEVILFDLNRFSLVGPPYYGLLLEKI